MTDLPTGTLFAANTQFMSIDTPPGNPNFPGPSDIYSLYNSSDEQIWGSTGLPIWVFNVSSTGLVLNPYGEDRDVELVGDRGSIYSWVERVPGELWGGLYSGKNQIVKFTPDRAGYVMTGIGINRGWRPYSCTTNGTVTWWTVGSKDSGSPTLGQILEVDASGSGTLHTVVGLDQDCRTIDYYNNKLYVCASGEGLPGATSGVDFYQIDVATMSIDWSVGLAGSRALSMYRLSATEYLIICHLTSDTVERLVLVDTAAQSRRWFSNQGIKIFGRSRNSIISWESELWCVADDGFYSINVNARNLIKRANFPAETATRMTNVVANDTYGLLVGDDLNIYQWDPR